MTGLYPASVTPFRPDGSFNPSALADLLKRNIREGASGFFIGGSSAECFLLSEKERVSVFETACAFKNETDIIAHVGAVSTDEAARYAQAAKKFGAKYIAAAPPFYYGFTAAQIAKYYYDISSAADMPVMVYNFPSNTGKPFNLNDPETVALFKSGAIWGVKHTNINVHQLERIRRLNPALIMMNGYDETMTAGLAMGADGSIGSTFSVMLPLYLKIYNAYRAGEGAYALELQTKANDVMDMFYSVGLIAAIKHALVYQGIDAGEPRRPFTPLTAEQKKLVEDAVEIPPTSTGR